MNQTEYRDYLKSITNQELSNQKQRKVYVKTQEGKIDSQVAQQLINNLNVNDNPLSITDAKTQLREYLLKYIKNNYYVDKIINSPKMTTDLLNQIVLNFETSVEPRLKSLSVSNANLSIDKVILLLENIGKQLLASTMNIDINDKLSNLRNVFAPEFQKYEGEIMNKDLPKLKQELITLNKQEFVSKGINDIISNQNRNSIKKKVKIDDKQKPYDTIDRLRARVKEILKIDRSFDNLYLACKKISNRIGTANIHFVSDEMIDDIINAIPFRNRDQWANLIKFYYAQCLSYDGLTFDAVRDVYTNRITGYIQVTNEVPNQQPMPIPATTNPNQPLTYDQLEEQEMQELVDDLHSYSADDLEQFNVKEYMEDKKFQILTEEDVKRIVDDFIRKKLEDELNASQGVVKTGKGISNNNNPALSENEKMIHGKYFINTRKLGAGILDIRYAKNRHQIPIKQQHISNDVQSMVKQLMGGKLDDTTYRKLPPIEKHLVRQLLPYFGKEKYDLNDEEAFHNRFEILKNEILSGNNNQAMKRELKAYLIHGLNTGLINRSTFNTVLLDLEL